ncbi:MAG: type B 50S ribosomal protein L31 [Flavobacteriales bacterium]|nr:type B 50S ribosomal protein L31 [Flavobacteriales bacterium]MBP6643763.1 type B 50S ribosomal protein L31 [Flavobacteriales bacterium]MBP7156619.1 type B 50S ribosomal protein L31 [Flavobacteriales bacterium]
MKADLHPANYRVVVFKDMSNDDMFLGKSCANTKDSIQYEDGNEYPLVKLDISQSSHPFYTGKMMLVDTAGRVDKFKKRFAKHVAKKDESVAAPEAAAPKAVATKATAVEPEVTEEAAPEASAPETAAE